MLKDYEEYLVRIRDNLIRCGVSLPVKRDYTYEELFNLGENISDILWFYGILAVVNSRARLMGFNWSLDRTLKGKLRSMFYDEYLEGKRSYDEISVEKFLEKKYGSQRVSEGYDESDDEDDQEDSGYDPPEQDIPVSSELKSSGNLSTAGMLAMFITQNNVNTSSSDEDENDDLENFNGGEVGDTYSGVQFDENDFPSDEEDEDDPEEAGGTFLDDEEEQELSEMDGTFLEDEDESEEGIPSFNEDDFPSEPENEEDDEEDLSDGSWLSDENEEDDSDDNDWFGSEEPEVEFSEDDFPDESDDEDTEDEVEFSDDDFPDESDEDEEDEEDEDIEFSDDDFPGFGDIDEEDEEDEEPTFKNAQSSNISQSSGNPSATPRPVKRQMTQMEKDIKSVEDASRILSTGVSKSKNVLKGILKGMIPKN